MMNICFHIFEMRDEEINAKTIIAVKYATYPVAKKEPENIYRLAWIHTLSSAILTSAVL